MPTKKPQACDKSALDAATQGAEMQIKEQKQLLKKADKDRKKLIRARIKQLEEYRETIQKIRKAKPKKVVHIKKQEFSTAALFLLDRGIRKAEEELGNRNENLFRFLCRYCATFPEYKDELFKSDIFRAYKNGDAKSIRIAAESEKKPLAKQDVIDFLNEYLPLDSSLRNSGMTHYQRAEYMRKNHDYDSWSLPVSSGGFPNSKKVENIFGRYDLDHGKAGRPQKSK